MGTVRTVLQGVLFNEKPARTAKIAARITVVWSMRHGEAAHERGTHNMFTGYRPSPALSYPSFGGVIAHEIRPRDNLPSCICYPSLPANEAGAEYLGSAFGAYALDAGPASPGFSVRDLALPGGGEEKRFATRQRLRDVVGRYFQRLDEHPNIGAMDEMYRRAYDLVGCARARAAFDIAAEPAAVRDAYGRNEAGQRMLLARRASSSACGSSRSPMAAGTCTRGYYREHPIVDRTLRLFGVAHAPLVGRSLRPDRSAGGGAVPGLRSLDAGCVFGRPIRHVADRSALLHVPATPPLGAWATPHGCLDVRCPLHHARGSIHSL